jgi:hypothetical protein
MACAFRFACAVSMLYLSSRECNYESISKPQRVAVLARVSCVSNTAAKNEFKRAAKICAQRHWRYKPDAPQTGGRDFDGWGRLA